MAKWLQTKDIGGYSRNMWIVEIQRVGSIRNKYNCEFQQQHIDHLFKPLFQATMSPEDPKNAALTWLLKQIGGFSINSDEDSREFDFTRKKRQPSEVSWSENPCDLYFSYYVWANICSLNAFRKRRGLNTFQFRSTGQRATQLDALVYSYLLCGFDHRRCAVARPACDAVLVWCEWSRRHHVAHQPQRSSSQVRRQPIHDLLPSRLEGVSWNEPPSPLPPTAWSLCKKNTRRRRKIYALSGVDVNEIARNSITLSLLSVMR